ncbi:MAG: twin-arginine translocase TatA/TatE family subunit [Alphaproteobacteria bacterium]
MIPGLSGAEFLAVAIIALLIVPSKDLPKVAREAGKLWVRLKHQIANIRSSFDKAMSEMELEEIKRTGAHIHDAMEPIKNPKEAAKKYVNKAIAAEQLNIADDIKEVQEEVSKVSEDLNKQEGKE